jgi:uncharacterized protein YfbU (UPF0304 family)
MTEMRLTDGEKIIIYLLAEILKTQKGYGDQNRMSLLQEAISGGHLWAINGHELFAGVFSERVDNDEEQKLVINSLDMWSFIEEAYQTFTDDEKKQVEDSVEFFGTNPQFTDFDGNYESEYMILARFVIDKLGWFQRFKGRELNSHAPHVDRYKRMIDVFDPIRVKLVGRGLTTAEMITLLKEQERSDVFPT